MVERAEWLIRKDGYFYRPNCQGYTTHKHEAGRYSEAKARAEAAVEPWHMKAIHESEWPDDQVSAAYNDKDNRIATLEAEVSRLTALLDEAKVAVGPFAEAAASLASELAAHAQTKRERDYAWEKMKNAEAYWRIETAHAQSAEAQRDSALNALEQIESDCRSTIDLYERNGPSFTSPSGEHYEPTSFVIAKMTEISLAARAFAEKAGA